MGPVRVRLWWVGWDGGNTVLGAVGSTKMWGKSTMPGVGHHGIKPLMHSSKTLFINSLSLMLMSCIKMAPEKGISDNLKCLVVLNP